MRLAPLVLVLAIASCACGPKDRALAPSPSATPTIAPGFARFEGHVIDENGAGLADVCVIIATVGSCQPASPRTDAQGHWSIDLPSGSDPSGIAWDITFEKSGYQRQSLRVLSSPGPHTLDMKLVRTTG